MPRPKIHDETQGRLDDTIDETVGVRPGYLTFNQKVEMLLDELEEMEQKNANLGKQVTKGRSR